MGAKAYDTHQMQKARKAGRPRTLRNPIRVNVMFETSFHRALKRYARLQGKSVSITITEAVKAVPAFQAMQKGGGHVSS